MRKEIKILMVCLCVLLLLCAAVAGTLAYLTDTAETVNTFTVGKVNIDLTEAKVDQNGTPVPNADRVTANSYRLIPGQSYTKDPTVTVKAGSTEAYVRMMVTITKAQELKDIFGGDFLPQEFVNDTWDSKLWPCVSVKENTDNTITYEFRFAETVDARENDVTLPALFESFTFPGEVTGEEIEALADLEIRVIGHAIQATGFENEEEAWAAFARQMANN